MAREDLIPNEPGLVEQLAESLAPRLAALNSRTEKSREVAALLFFTHGIYPSAQKVRAITQHGSLSDINSDLAAFWRDLRSRSKVQLDLPEFPVEITEVFSEALRKIWVMANEQAQQLLASAYEEARREVEAAREQTQLAEERYQIEARQSQRLREDLQQERDLRVEQERSAEGLRVEVVMLNETIKTAHSKLENEAAAREASERRFTFEMEQERITHKADIEVLEKEMAYSKLQIDRARQEAKDKQAQAIAERQQLHAEILSYRQRVSHLEDELLESRKKLRLALTDVATKPAAGRSPATKNRLMLRKNLRGK